MLEAKAPDQLHARNGHSIAPSLEHRRQADRRRLLDPRRSPARTEVNRNSPLMSEILNIRHFLTIIDHDAETLRYLLNEAARLKAEVARGKFADSLQHKIIGLVLEKPSLRTRVSFEA